MNETIPGHKAVAQRMVNAEQNFVALVVSRAACSEAEAVAVLAEYRRLKLVRMDAVSGRIMVRHGALWEADVLKRVVSGMD